VDGNDEGAKLSPVYRELKVRFGPNAAMPLLSGDKP